MTEPIFDQATLADLRENVGDEPLQVLLSLLPNEGETCLNEIKSALGRGDLETARQFAHRLKGVASNIGAARLAALARELEQEAETLEAAEQRVTGLDTALEQTREALSKVA